MNVKSCRDCVFSGAQSEKIMQGHCYRNAPQVSVAVEEEKHVRDRKTGVVTVFRDVRVRSDFPLVNLDAMRCGQGEPRVSAPAQRQSRAKAKRR